MKLEPPKNLLGKIIYHTLPYVDNFMAGYVWYRVFVRSVASEI